MPNLFCTITNYPMLGMEGLNENTFNNAGFNIFDNGFFSFIDRSSRTERIVREDS